MIPNFSCFLPSRGDKSALLHRRGPFFLTVLHQWLLHVPVRDPAAPAPHSQKVS